MKRFWKELLLLLLQAAAFYLLPLPLIASPAGPIAMVLILFGITLLLSLLMGSLSKEPGKYAFPVLTALLFLPSIFLYYNSSAAVHALWYLAVSAFGVALGALLRKLVRALS